MYKGPLRIPLRRALLELAGRGLEIDVAPKSPGKLLGVKSSPIHITVKLCKRLQSKGPAGLTSTKSHIALDGVYLQGSLVSLQHMYSRAL